MLTDADWFWVILTDGDWCLLMLIDADWFWLMLIDADWCSNKVQPGFLLSERISGVSPEISYCKNCVLCCLSLLNIVFLCWYCSENCLPLLILFWKLSSFVERHFKICQPSHSVYPGYSSRKSWRQKQTRIQILQLSIWIILLRTNKDRQKVGQSCPKIGSKVFPTCQFHKKSCFSLLLSQF